MKLSVIGYTAALLMPLFSFAQSNFKPGYVVGFKGDTLKGSIDYKEWEKNPAQVTFKDNSGTTQVYTPQNAEGFGVNGMEYYKTYSVRVSQDIVDIDKLGTQLDTTSNTGAYFLRLLAKGKYLELYSYQDAVKLRFYLLRSGDSRPEELEYHVYYDPDKSSSIQYVNRYRTQMQYAAQQAGVANSQLESRILDARYDNTDLVNIVNKINGGSAIPSGSMSRSGIRWFAGLAVMDNTLKTEDVIDAPPTHTILPKISAGIDFLPNKNVQQLVLRGEVSLSAGSYSFANSSAYPPFSGHFKQNTISIVPQFLFNFYNTDKLKLFIDGGIAFNLSQYSNYSINFTTIVYNDYPPLSKLWISIPLKMGVLVNKRIEIYAGYTPLTNLTTVSDFPVTLTTYQAGLNYTFGAK